MPLVTYVDRDACLFLKDRKCAICVLACKPQAIEFDQAEEKIEIGVGAIILSPGFEPFDPRLREDYGYGKMQNVVTSLEYERLLCSNGPFEGEILRPSDKKPPHKIAWIQCVGSRQVTPGGNSYCSAVCCTYAQKQVILTKERDAEAECTIFHNDIRSYGKDFERFYERAHSLPGVRFVRRYPALGREIPGSKNITLRYAADDEVREEEFDMVVLSVGLSPPADAKDLAATFGVELNSHGFCHTSPFNPVKTSRPGMFIAGAFQGPLDIPESVFGASAAGSRCGELLGAKRGLRAKERVFPPETNVPGEEPRVGVYVCHCGANIRRVVDVPSVVAYASTLGNVVHAQEALFACSADAAREMVETIHGKRLNRVVVAACSPRTLEPLFRDTLREAGVNQYCFDMANIREQCSWVHAKDKHEATEKAKDLIRMSVARVCYLKPLQEVDLPVNKAALVVGGGIAGMNCAVSIANQGHEVYLIERETELGGIARRLHYTMDGLDVPAYLHNLIKTVYDHPLIHVFENTVVTKTLGYVGNFLTSVTSPRGITEIRHGAAVIATGAEVYKPTEYLYGADERVVTSLELEERIARGAGKIARARSVVMIQCVGCRNEERNYCSRICCSQSVKNALKLKEMNPEMDITILYRDMRTYGVKEDYYREAANKYVRFVRYEPEDGPQVTVAQEGGKQVLRVTLTEPILGKKLELDADLIALAVAVVPNKDNRDLSLLFRVALGPDDWFKEAHVKLRPVEFGAEGMHLCGMAHYPKFIPEAISQALGAAGRVLTLLSHDTVFASGSVCEVDEEKCTGCGACADICTYGAIELRAKAPGKKRRIAVVNPALCKGDGLCNTTCRKEAISLKHFTDEEILAQIDAALAEEK